MKTELEELVDELIEEAKEVLPNVLDDLDQESVQNRLDYIQRMTAIIQDRYYAVDALGVKDPSLEEDVEAFIQELMTFRNGWQMLAHDTRGTIDYTGSNIACLINIIRKLDRDGAIYGVLATIKDWKYSDVHEVIYQGRD